MRTVALMLGVLLLVPPPLQMAAAGRCDAGNEPVVDPPAPGWWSDWFRDADENGIDDLLDRLDAGAVANVFVDYDHRPGRDDAEAAGAFGSGLHDARFIDTLALYDVPARFFDDLAALPGVVMVELQPEYRKLLDVSVPSLRVRPSATYRNDVWGMLGVRGNGTTVAIIDTGVDNRLHESLDDLDDDPSTTDPKFVAGYDCSGTIWFTGDPVDNDGHGTHVAGIAVGTGGPQRTYAGVAPGARLVDIKVMNFWGSAPAGKVMEGVRWAMEHRTEFNISVISLSLGTSTSSDGNDAVSQLVNQAVRAGMVAVIAAGNDGPHNSGLGAPAAADDAITVGATDDAGTVDRKDDYLAHYSSRGPRRSDLDLDSTDELKPELSAPGSNIMSALAGSSGSYISLSGTSMACPHVSGLCALMLEANGDLAPARMRRILEETAESRGTPYNSSLAPKYNTGFGFGIADGFGAVRRALDSRSGGWQAPPTATGGSPVSVALSMNWTRTEFTTDPDALFFNVTAPAGWGMPYSVVASGGDVASSAQVLPVDASGSDWSVRGWLNYTGVPQSPANLTPSLSFVSVAPAVGQPTPFRFTGSFLANNLAWNASDLTVLAVPGGQVRADLSIAPGDIAFDPADPSAGDPVRVDVRVRNGGTVGASSEVALYDGPPGAKTYIGRFGVSVQASGEGSGSLVWTSSAGRHTLTAVADPDGTIPETDETNNAACATLEVLGFNRPPAASLAASPTSVRTGETVTLDGSGSTDADGTVNYYSFDFGDGTSTGWTTRPTATHSYLRGGDFRARLTVQDNGAAEGTAVSEVSVVQAGELTLLFYLEREGRLTILSPQAPEPASEPLPAGTGFTPVGTWRAAALGRNVTVGGNCDLRLQVGNPGTSPVSGLSLELTVLSGQEAINRTVTAPAGVPAGGNITVAASLQLPATAVPADPGPGLRVAARAEGGGLRLFFGGSAFRSTVRLTLVDPPELPPEVSAGPDIECRSGGPARLDGRGLDPEGTPLVFEWDFEGDGRFDTSGTTGTADHVYPATGTFGAVIRARDGAGLTGQDTATVTVREKNRPPVVQGGTPEGPVRMEEGDVQLFRVAALDPDGDALSYGWQLDDTPLPGADGPDLLFRAAAGNIGRHGLRVSVSDGSASATYSWTVQVVGGNHPPTIASREPDRDAVSLREEEYLRFSVAAFDPDGDRLSTEWTLDGERAGAGTDFLYAPDSSSAGTHSLRATVSDGRANASVGWSIRVDDLNRAPRVNLLTPADGQMVAFGSEVLFECRASDADGDGLSFNWSTDLEGSIGTSESFVRVLGPGTHRVRLEVSDGKERTVVELTLTVRQRPAGEGRAPGFGAGAWVAAAVAALVLLGRRGRGRGSGERAAGSSGAAGSGQQGGSGQW
ncbi:MAG: PKD domain-containing protein [Euryarchaeota archaeon]|nr:PKD domain-containing protein [Euryarchaeota archaeon]